MLLVIVQSVEPGATAQSRQTTVAMDAPQLPRRMESGLSPSGKAGPV
jgi:hypothetical protein